MEYKPNPNIISQVVGTEKINQIRRGSKVQAKRFKHTKRIGTQGMETLKKWGGL